MSYGSTARLRFCRQRRSWCRGSGGRYAGQQLRAQPQFQRQLTGRGLSSDQWDVHPLPGRRFDGAYLQLGLTEQTFDLGGCQARNLPQQFFQSFFSILIQFSGGIDGLLKKLLRQEQSIGGPSLDRSRALQSAGG